MRSLLKLLELEEVRGLNTNPNIIGSKMWDWKKGRKHIRRYQI